MAAVKQGADGKIKKSGDKRKGEDREYDRRFGVPRAVKFDHKRRRERDHAGHDGKEGHRNSCGSCLMRSRTHLRQEASIANSRRN